MTTIEPTEEQWAAAREAWRARIADLEVQASRDAVSWAALKGRERELEEREAAHLAHIKALRTAVEAAEKMRRLVVKVVCSPAAANDGVVVSSTVCRALDDANLQAPFGDVLADTAHYDMEGGEG
jgi:hypothetical protein